MDSKEERFSPGNLTAVAVAGKLKGTRLGGETLDTGIEVGA